MNKSVMAAIFSGLSSCPGLTRASMEPPEPSSAMDCRVEPGNDKVEEDPGRAPSPAMT